MGPDPKHPDRPQKPDQVRPDLSLPMLCYRKCPRLGLDFPPFDHTDGLDASGNFMSAAGTLFPMALWGLSSL
jgi:hypothetical protein